MIDRRQALSGALMESGLALAGYPSGATAAALPVPAGNRLGFDILRKGSKLGTHVITFAAAGDRLTLG